MNPETKARITRFLNDEQTSNAVYSVLQTAFLKTRGTDVHILAAGKLSIDFLNEAWKELEKCRIAEKSTEERTNPGV